MRELPFLINFELKRLIKSRAISVFLILIMLVLPIIMNNLDTQETIIEKWYGTLQLQMVFLLILIPSMVSYVWKGYLQSFERAVILLKLTNRAMYIVGKIVAVLLFVSVYLFFFYVIFFIFYANKIPISILLTTLFQVFLSIFYSITFSFFISFYLKRTVYLHILLIVYLVFSIYLNSPYFSIWFNPDYIQHQMTDLLFNVKRSIFLSIGILFMFGNVLLFKRRVNDK